MLACLSFALIVAIVSVPANGQQDGTEPDQCLAKQFEELKKQNRKDMVYVYSALKSIDKTLGAMKRYMIDVNGKDGQRSIDNLLAAHDAIDEENEDSPRYRRGVHDVGDVFVLLHDKAIETSADVKKLLENTDDVETSLNSVSSTCGRLPLVLDELEEIKANQEFYKRPKSCEELLETGNKMSGPYMVYPDSHSQGFEVGLYISSVFYFELSL